MALRDQLLGTGSSIYNALGGTGANLLPTGFGGVASGIGSALGNMFSSSAGPFAGQTASLAGTGWESLGGALGGLGPVGVLAAPITMGLGMGLGPNAFNMAEDQRQLGMMHTARNRISDTLKAGGAPTTPDLETAWLGYDQTQNPWQNLGTPTVPGISDYLSNPVETWPGANPSIAPEHGTRFINDLGAELGAKAIESGIATDTGVGNQPGGLLEPGGSFSILGQKMDQGGLLNSVATGKHLNLPAMYANLPDVRQHLGWRQDARNWFASPTAQEIARQKGISPSELNAQDYWGWDRDIGYDSGE